MFSFYGALQLKHDMNTLFMLFKPFSKNPGNLYFRKLKDITTLLSVPTIELKNFHHAFADILLSASSNSRYFCILFICLLLALLALDKH